MEVIKRKILLEEGIDRTTGSQNWGKLTADTFYVKVLLTQNYDDMGLFTDMSFIPKDSTNSTVDYSPLITKLQSLGLSFPFMLGAVPQPVANLTNEEKSSLRLPTKIVSDYYFFGNDVISGRTDSKLEDVRSYAASDPYRINFNVSSETYENYENITILGVNRIKSMDNPKIYVFDTPVDGDLGTETQIFGLQYKDYDETVQTIENGEIINTPLTTFRFIGEGWNNTNTSLSATTKEEYLFGIISEPEVESDVFIERGSTSVMDRHLRLSEIKNLAQLDKYGNGYYKLFKQ